MSLCKMLLIGNLGRDPEMRYTPSGRPVTQFTLAVNRNTKNQEGEWQEQTEWFRVTAWGQLAERTAEQLRKGSKVFVEGRFQSREWEGQDGQKRTALEVTADTVLTLDRRQRDEEGGEAGFPARPAAAPKPAPAGGGYDESSDIDDLPF
ncbi:MAG TPA: single-stranded DNA-binding protein [Candidatus Limnocylindrales bacterium]